METTFSKKNLGRIILAILILLALLFWRNRVNADSQPVDKIATLNNEKTLLLIEQKSYRLQKQSLINTLSGLDDKITVDQNKEDEIDNQIQTESMSGITYMSTGLK